MSDKDNWWKDDKENKKPEVSDNLFTPKSVQNDGYDFNPRMLNENFNLRRELADKIKKNPNRPKRMKP